MRRSRALLATAVTVLLALTVGACAGGGSSGGGRAGTVFDATFERMDGTAGSRSFADYRGRPVVVNFFSSTCTPCVTEMPTLQKVHEQLGAAVAFVGIDVQDTVEAGRSFVAAVKVTWDIGRDPKGGLVEQAGGIGLPTTVILDRDGRIVWLNTGVVKNVDDLTGALRDHGLLT